MPNVYFKPVGEKPDDAELSRIAVELLQTMIEREHLSLEQKIPLKVHFGEAGNKTYLKPAVYQGLIDFLQHRGIETCYMETSVLYGGERFERERHVKLAEKHGFTQIPVVIADGEKGEDSVEIEVGKHHFHHCSIARELSESPQVLVLAHFKGHMLAGFGGALKQLSMGFASKGGKLAMHMGVKPRIRNLFCRHCKLCRTRCNADAITIGKRSFIDHDKCIGCGACFSICPHHAISIFSFAGIWNALFKGKFFREKLAEYAYASHHGKKHLYLNFATAITRGCDCEPHPMRPCVGNIGVYASTDPVAIDSACYDAVAAKGKRFRGHEILTYAEKIGVGSCSYTLIDLGAGADGTTEKGTGHAPESK